MDTENLRHPLRAVGIDFGEKELPSSLIGELLERRAQNPAGPTPLRPEIDDDGQLVRPLQHIRFEGLVGDVDHCGGSFGHDTPAKTPSCCSAGFGTECLPLSRA